jgi:hypothetical protein
MWVLFGIGVHLARGRDSVSIRHTSGLVEISGELAELDNLWSRRHQGRGAGDTVRLPPSDDGGTGDTNGCFCQTTRGYGGGGDGFSCG